MSPEPEAAPLDRDAVRALTSWRGVARLLAVLDDDGEETRIVGGAIRNALIGKPVHEIDLATTALPDETTRRARAAGFRPVPTGIEHGTVTVVVDQQPFEVTTLREDVETDGRHAVVRFGRDFVADARRRDFTINALSLGRDGAIHDYTDGLADLARRRIRFIGEAGTRIREDYLRILRFFRFHAEYGEGALDPEGLDAAIRGRDGLARLSRERIRAELLKLLAAPRAVEIATAMEQAGLLGRLVTAPGDAGRLGRAAGLDPIMCLAAYLVRTEADADRLRDGLRLSNAEHERLRLHAGAAGRLHSHPGALDAADVKRLVFAFGPVALAETARILAGEPSPVFSADSATLLARYTDGSEAPPHFPLSGADLIRAGLAPGPDIGRRLAAEREAWLAAGCPEHWPPGA